MTSSLHPDGLAEPCSNRQEMESTWMVERPGFVECICEIDDLEAVSEWVDTLGRRGDKLTPLLAAAIWQRQRCTAAAAKNAYDGLEHRPTISYVRNSLKDLCDSV